ncbi:MAG: TauD/TfdA family dioxygenase [Alphaproteobacteria bacterium]|nr:TauD/TfdA family dioxygenase [Alphaproteobacteria bacterium]
MTTIEPATGPAIWRGRDLTPDDWLATLAPAEIDDIDAALRALGDRVPAGATEFPLPTMAARLRDVADRLEHGRGVVLLRGLPVARYSPAQLERLYRGIGLNLGSLRYQSRKGDTLGYVTDLGGTLGTVGVRGYETRARLSYHCDRCDVVSLLCVRHARSGGLSTVVSAGAVHNAMLARAPELLAALYEPVPSDRRDEQKPGLPRFTMFPIFARVDGRFVTRYVRDFVRSVSRLPEAPAVTERQWQAMALLDEICNEPGMSLDMEFRPGDIQFLNNYVTYHARTAFEDWPEPERRRLLLRLWLSVPNSRALPESYRDLYGEVRAGAPRGGVAREALLEGALTG